MTGEQQFNALLADVTASAQRSAWPIVARPFTGPVVRDERDWRKLLDTLARARNRWAVEALGFLESQLRDVQREGLNVRSDPEPAGDRDQDVSVTPSPREFEILCQALRCAQDRGLSVDRCEVRWFERGYEDYQLADGFFVPSDSSGGTIWLQRGLTADELYRTCLHELAHLHDVLTLGREGYLSLPKAERERRANAFEYCAAEGL